MTDPLGQSQVLPYIIELSKFNYNFTLISFEKKKRYEILKNKIQKICDVNNINWHPQTFHTFPPFVSKFYDLFKMKQIAYQLHKENNFDFIHCRSYQSAEVAMMLKKKTGVKYLFDMRGFWVDERVDGGMWNLNNPFFKIAYKYYKNIESKLIGNADAIISLTEAGKREIESWKSYNKAPIMVIPCSADFSLFKLLNKVEKDTLRKDFGYNNNDIVISYLGSLGTWYMLEEMLEFFNTIYQRNKNFKFLFITQDDENIIYSKLSIYNIPKSVINVVQAKREEVQMYLNISNINLFFITQKYSKIASSPTKLGEVYAVGLPVICNDQVGDVKEIVNDVVNGGVVISEFNTMIYNSIYNKIETLLELEPEEIRQKALPYYDINNAIKKYLEVYQQLG